MNYLVAALIIVSPALLGASLMFLIVSLVSAYRSAGVLLIAVGSGISAGYIIIARLMWFIDQANLKVFSWMNIHGFCTVTVIIVFLASMVFFHNRRAYFPVQGVQHPKTNTSAVTFCCLVVLLCYTAFHILFMPASGWDSIDWWLATGDRFITVDDALLPQFIWDYFNYLTWDSYPYYDWAGQPPVAYASPYQYEHYHPITIPIIASYSGFWAHELNAIELNVMPWFLCWLSTLTVIAGVLHECGVNKRALFMALYVVSAVPLIENHNSIAGYADLWLGAIAVSSLALMSIAASSGRNVFNVLGLLFALFLIAIKNSGPIHFALILVSYAIVSMPIQTLRKAANGVLLIGSVLLCLVILGVNFHLAGVRWGVSRGDEIVVHLAGRSFVAELQSLTSVTNNLFVAFVENLSYSVAPLVACLAVIVWRCRQESALVASDVLNRSLGLFLCFGVALSVLLLLAQAIWPAAYQVASVGSDTANTRHHLPAVISMLIFSFLVFFTRPLEATGRYRETSPGDQKGD